MSTQSVRAWKLEVAPGQCIALGEAKLLEYLSDVHTYAVPATPKGCNHLVRWHQHVIPVFDLHGWMNGHLPNNGAQRLAVLPIHIETQNSSEKSATLIAIKLYGSPERISVQDDQFCDELHHLPKALQPHTRSLIKRAENYIPILDLDDLLLTVSRADSSTNSHLVH